MMKRIHRFFLVTIVIILQFHEVHSLSYTGILAGGHGCGSSGDGGPAFSAMVNNTYGVWSDTVEDENKEGKKILMQKDKQDMPEDKQIDQEMNLNTREEEIRSIEDLQHDGDSLMSINSYFKDLDDISSFFEEVSNSTTSEYDEERGFL
eukprot:gene6637-7148_t